MRASIGIIGGADGPTVVLLSGNAWLEIVLGVAVIAVIVTLVIVRRRKNHK